MGQLASLFSARNYALVLPKSEDEDIGRYVAMHSAERDSVERRPFRRQVDFWAFAIAAALALKLEPRDGSPTSWGKRFIYTSQGILDDNLSSLLAVIAVAKMGHDHPEVAEIRRVVDLANRLAGAGCPYVLRKLSENALRTTPLDRAMVLAGSLQEKIRSDQYTEASRTAAMA